MRSTADVLINLIFNWEMVRRGAIPSDAESIASNSTTSPTTQVSLGSGGTAPSCRIVGSTASSANKDYAGAQVPVRLGAVAPTAVRV